MKTSQKRAILGLIVGGSLAAGIFGCPASFPDVGPYGALDDGGDADGQIVPPGCDLSADPKDSAACVDESIGLFVSATGSDSNAGTKGSPLKTITAALAKVSSQHSRVYVCDGTYGEGVKVTSAVGIYGGFSCTDWSYDGTAGQVGPAGTGYALDIEGVTGTVTIEDLEFDAQNGKNPGDSSIAVFVASSTVTLKRVKAVAGNGVTGADAIATSNYDVDAGTAPIGNSVLTDASAGNVGGAACVNKCISGGTSTGGAGGNVAQSGADGGPGIPENPTGQSPKHNGVGGSCGTTFAGPGADAFAADGGAAGADVSGTISSSGWSAKSGETGGLGSPGQGGGGGGGGLGPTNGAGGGGGCGGCGGAGGGGGGSGGSSFAILAYQATITLDACSLQAGTGGDGKSGGSGQGGQMGGLQGAAVIAAGGGCNGAPGGNGGAGAGGGGGAGGNAIAIGYVGAKPTVTGGTMSEGTAGSPGEGGTGAAGNDGLPGVAGTKADIQELP